MDPLQSKPLTKTKVGPGSNNKMDGLLPLPTGTSHPSSGVLGWDGDVSSLNFRGGFMLHRTPTVLPVFPPPVLPPPPIVQFPFQRARISPNHLELTAAVSALTAKTEEFDMMNLVAKETRRLLDDLKLENLDEMVPKFKAIPLNNAKGRITCFIAVIYGKALERPSYSDIYARMLKTFCETSQFPEDVSQKFVKEIRKYFNRFIVESRKGNATLWTALNHFKFIEELYKAKLLPAVKTMVPCVHFVIYGVINDQVLEALCLLLTNIGRELEKEVEPSWKDKMLAKLELLIGKEEISEKARSAMMNLVQLWKNEWTPRYERFNGFGAPEIIPPKKISTTTEESESDESTSTISSSSLSTIDVAADEEVPVIEDQQLNIGIIKYDRNTLLMIGDKGSIPDFNVAELGFPSLVKSLDCSGHSKTNLMQFGSKIEVMHCFHKEPKLPFEIGGAKAKSINVGNWRTPTPVTSQSPPSHIFMEPRKPLQHSLPPPKPAEVNPSQTENVSLMMTPSTITETETDPKTEALIIKSLVKRARNMLNKLTTESFSKLEPSFLALPFENKDDRISNFITIMFERAVERHSSSSAYARMIQTICKASPEMEMTKTKFATLIVRQAHSEFCESSKNKKEMKILRDKLASTKFTEIELKLLNQELDERKKLNRERAIGSVTFLGELFKAEILTPKNMVGRINCLLNLPDDEENFECLCLLLRNVGQMLEKALAAEEVNTSTSNPDPSWMDKVFETLKNLNKANKISSELRYTVVDLVKSRQNGWNSQPLVPAIKKEDHEAMDHRSWRRVASVSNNNNQTPEAPESGAGKITTPASGNDPSSRIVSPKDTPVTPKSPICSNGTPTPPKSSMDLLAKPGSSATPKSYNDLFATPLSLKEKWTTPVSGKNLFSTAVSLNDRFVTLKSATCNNSAPATPKPCTDLLAKPGSSATPKSYNDLFASPKSDNDIAARPKSPISCNDISASASSANDKDNRTVVTSMTTTTTTVALSRNPPAPPSETGLSICEDVLDTEMKNAALSLQLLSDQGSDANLERKSEVLKYIRDLAHTMESVRAMKIATSDLMSQN